ncbi:hypothetical protein [Helicobacter pylori]|uniref:hypothetical protein n=1 Tax=Helicobacter pylori TaxID=210 RepID=UPI003F5C06AB
MQKKKTKYTKTPRFPPPPPNNEELLKSVEDLTDRFKKLEGKLEDLEPLIKISRCIGSFFGKSSNDTQENSKDAQGREEALKKVQEENTELKTEKENLNNQLNASQKQAKELEQSQQVLKNKKPSYQKIKKI